MVVVAAMVHHRWERGAGEPEVHPWELELEVWAHRQRCGKSGKNGGSRNHPLLRCALSRGLLGSEAEAAEQVRQGQLGQAALVAAAEGQVAEQGRRERRYHLAAAADLETPPRTVPPAERRPAALRRRWRPDWLAADQRGTETGPVGTS